jgi:homoserine dehydrogenase
LQVKDQPGVVAAIADILGRKGISISSFIQREGCAESVPLLIVTHEAKEKLVKEAIAEFENLDVVCGNVKLIRIEDM